MNCYVVVNLLRKGRLKNRSYILGKGKKNEQKFCICSRWKAKIYNDSGDDGKEVPPVPIPNTEVKLFYAESTCRLLLGG